MYCLIDTNCLKGMNGVAGDTKKTMTRKSSKKIIDTIDTSPMIPSTFNLQPINSTKTNPIIKATELPPPYFKSTASDFFEGRGAGTGAVADGIAVVVTGLASPPVLSPLTSSYGYESVYYW